MKKNKSSCLDHGFIDQRDYNFTCKKTFILHSSTSDHYTQVLGIECDHRTPSQENKFYIHCEIDKNNLIKKLEKEKWEDIYMNEDPNGCMDSLISKVKNYIVESSTQKTKKIEKK